MKRLIAILILAIGLAACGSQAGNPQVSAPPDNSELFSSGQLGICFSYPKEYTLNSGDSVQISAPDLPGADVKGVFWLEINDSQNRTAEEIADEDLSYAMGLNVGRWSVDLGGEQAVVLDGMPGQELQRRVYIVHEQKFYMLGFWPALSQNQTAVDQMEALYKMVTDTWEWSFCSSN